MLTSIVSYPKLSDDTVSIRDTLPTPQASTVAIKANVDTLHTRTQAIKGDTVYIQNALPPPQGSTITIRGAQSLQQHHAIMEWLSPTDFTAQQHDIITRRQEGTGQWFLDSPEFKRWLQGSDKMLFCPGMPIAGKTMQSSTSMQGVVATRPLNEHITSCLRP